VKRRVLLQHIERHGCHLVREGSKHSRYVNLADPTRLSTVPRHPEISDFLAKKICRQPGIPDPF